VGHPTDGTEMVRSVLKEQNDERNFNFLSRFRGELLRWDSKAFVDIVQEDKFRPWHQPLSKLHCFVMTFWTISLTFEEMHCEFKNVRQIPLNEKQKMTMDGIYI
jgi:hypothetical protein